ncbi:MAG: tetratricopeptide repeat protein [Candidatus Acidiferrales bacterium]
MKESLRRVSGVLALALAASFLLASCFRNPEKSKLNYVAKGQAYMKKGQYSSAAIEYRNALKIDPRYVDAYIKLAQADEALRDGNSAYAALEKAVQIDPNRVDARLERAKLMIAARLFPKAEDDANFVLKLDPNNADAYRIRGSAFAAEKKYDQALQDYSKAAKLEPTEAGPYLDVALVEMALHRFPEAEQSMKQAIQVAPSSVQSYVDLANFYRLQNKVPEAEQILQQGVKWNPNAIPIYIDWASVLASTGKQADADNVLDQLRSQVPQSSDAALSIGDFYFQRKMTDQALAEYKRGLALASKAPLQVRLTIQERIEDLYLSTGQSDQAVALDQEIMKESPKDVTGRIGHGRLLMAQGKSQEAVDELQKVAADAADSPQAHYYLGMAYWQDNDPGQAGTELQSTLRISPGLPIALRALTQLNEAQGNFAVAQIYAQELVQKDQKDPSYRLLLGEVLLRQGAVKKAEEQLTTARSLAPADPEIHVAVGQLYAAEKKIPEAQKEFDAAMSEAPASSFVVSHYAAFLNGNGQQAKALSVAQQFVTANENDPAGHLLLGSIQLADKNYAPARSEIEKAIQLNPKLFEAYLQLGQLFRDQGDDNDAAQAYEKGLALQPRSAPVATAVGNIYLSEGNLDKASQKFQQALADDPGMAIAANNLAWVYAEQGKNLDVALGLAQKAKSLNPETPSFSDTLAWVMYKKGDYSGAIPLLQDCVKKDPKSAQYRYHLGMTLLASGQKNKGKVELEAALHMKLDSADAQQARQALGQAQ